MAEIEEVRELPYVGNWYRPPARSSLMRLSKGDLIEYIALAFKNWHGTEETLQRSVEYHRQRDEECDDARRAYDELKRDLLATQKERDKLKDEEKEAAR